MRKIAHLIIQKGILVLSICCAAFHAEAQLVIGQPTLDFTRACAGADFNSYEATFIFNPSTSLGNSNTFVLELSDAEGNFDQENVIFTSNPGEITESPATIFFSIPTDTAGENYKIRIKSTSPVATSAPSVSFAAYYKLHDTPFTINELMAEATFCPSASYLLTIDNPTFDGSVSPLFYDSLTFNWFKAIDQTNSELVAQGETFEVTEEGIYFAQTNYGSCSSQSFSNRVYVSLATDDEPANTVITSSLGNPFCASDEGTTLTTITGDKHEWFKDDVAIEGVLGNTIQTKESGNYAVIVTIGSCVAVGSIALENVGSTFSIDVPAINFIEPGESLLATISPAQNFDTQYEWYLNGELIENATENTFSATEFGNYSVVVVTSGECDNTTEFAFEVKTLVNVDNIPNMISPNGDGVNDTWMIPADYVSGTNTEVTIMSSFGNTVLKTTTYNNNWPEDIGALDRLSPIYYYMINAPDKEAIKGSITVLR